ncbi:MAG: hypothetical protein OXF51_05775 [Alphaproteobacteria bacterium]|nr:hypothetical protein [Alphaproteobacteria bacterium]
MPQIVLPEALANRIEAIDIHLEHPSQLAINSPWTGSRQILDRGYPRWAGSCQIYPADIPFSQTEWLEIEAFFDALNGAGNTFAVPHMRTPATVPANVTARSSTVSDAGNLVHRLSAALTNPAPGQMLQAGERTYRLRAVDGRDVILDPQRPLQRGAVIAASTTLLARAARLDGVVSFRSFPNAAAGPWTLDFVEA